EYTKKINRGTGPVVIGILSQEKTDVPPMIDRLAAFDPRYIDLKENNSLYTLLV
ncbi:MAG TPA: threonine dehydratase, partial [Tetragenococcus sp.]|nr:threonine dehydratase [Tetragenococcus sp.]